MDDFVLSNLQESRNEWCSRLVSIFCPLVMEGVKSIFNESYKICEDTAESDKYLMTFQNFLSRIPKWNSVTIEDERKRIVERSGCTYLEDLITCVHIIQLKVLTCIRVGNKQKKIDITIPKLDTFIHKVYIHVARKVYMNVYLFEKKTISPLQMLKNMREFELIVQECILTTIRDSIPTEEIIRAYMDECVETDEEVTIEPLAEPVVEGEEDKPDHETTGAEDDNAKIPSIEDDMPIVEAKITNLNDDPVTTVSFHELDSILDERDKVKQVDAPKTMERLTEISTSAALQRKFEEDESLEDNIKIHTDHLSMDDLGIMDLDSEHHGGSGKLMSSSSSVEDQDLSSLLGIEDI